MFLRSLTTREECVVSLHVFSTRRRRDVNVVTLIPEMR